MPFRDEAADLRRENEESEGQQLLRHLQGIVAMVAWHAAAKRLLDRKYRQVAQTLRIGLVEVTPNNLI